MERSTLRGLGVADGIIAVLFGIAAVFWPGETLVTLLYLFATLVILRGIINLITGIFHMHVSTGAWFLKLLVAVVELGVGIYLFRHPHVTFTTFILLLGFTLIIRGLFDLVASFMVDYGVEMRTLDVITGGLAVVVGIIVLLQPVSSGVAFVWVIGLYALIAGPITIAEHISEKSFTKPAGRR